MFAKNGTFRKKRPQQGMCFIILPSSMFMKGQGFYSPAEHPYQNIISGPRPPDIFQKYTVCMLKYVTKNESHDIIVIKKIINLGRVF